MRNPWPLDAPLLLDRADARRETVDLTACDAVIVRDGAVLVRDGRVLELPPADQPEALLRIYLGRDGERDLVALVPADPAALEERADGARLDGLRTLLAGFWARGARGAREHELATTAVAISQWHASHAHCARCGAATEPVRGGWVRRCPACGREHYPRTDPAVICAITDPDDRILLAHAAAWAPHRYSHVAGYVEPGETFEQAVHREVSEEVGLRLHSLRYLGSQPWPFPASVMVGFTAVTDVPEPRVDGVEIAHAMFASRADLERLVHEGEVALAPTGSIAYRMLEHWYGGPLPTAAKPA